MALLDSELARIKVELGFNALSISALPYAIDGVTQVFEQIIKPYLEAGEVNSSDTPVEKSADGTPTLVTLTIVPPTAIAVGDRLIVDVDDAQEAATVRKVGINTVDVKLVKAHVGTYPLTVEGGESMVRYYLQQCIQVADKISKAASRAGIKRVDRIEFFPRTGEQQGVLDDLFQLQKHWRNELARICGVGSLRQSGGGGGSTMEAY